MFGVPPTFTPTKHPIALLIFSIPENTFITIKTEKKTDATHKKKERNNLGAYEKLALMSLVINNSGIAIRTGKAEQISTTENTDS